MPSDYERIERSIRFLDEHAGEQPSLARVAKAVGLNPEGGSRNFSVATRPTESELWQYLRVVRGLRQRGEIRLTWDR